MLHRPDVHRLLNPQDAKTLPPLYSTEHVEAGQKVATIKWFTPRGRGTWYAMEGGARLTDGSEQALASVEDWSLVEDVLFFGYVVSPLGTDCDEWGTFVLSEFLTLAPGTLERDTFFKPQVLSVYLGKVL